MSARLTPAQISQCIRRSTDMLDWFCPRSPADRDLVGDGDLTFEEHRANRDLLIDVLWAPIERENDRLLNTVFPDGTEQCFACREDVNHCTC